MTTRKYYDMELQTLNEELMRMGEMICKAISGAIGALLERDNEKAREIIAFDDEIDRQNQTIEQLCYKLLLSQQPVAGDLRMVSAAIRMTTDMERIGDHAADISEIELMLEKLTPLYNDHLRQMATETSVMLMKSIESFAEKDDLFDTVKNELIDAIHKDSANGEQATDLLMAAKYFERIGDHATNIAEWAIFAITGKRALG